MSISDKSEIEDILDRVKEQAKVDRELIKGQLGDQPYGHRNPTDKEFLMWWEMKLAENPPMWIVAPNGMQFMASPFEVMMTLAVNGREWIKRYRDAQRREAERALEEPVLYRMPEYEQTEVA